MSFVSFIGFPFIRLLFSGYASFLSVTLYSAVHDLYHSPLPTFSFSRLHLHLPLQGIIFLTKQSLLILYTRFFSRSIISSSYPILLILPSINRPVAP
ncbi:MAG: hypothetical protein NXY57DRAFT_578734 [Lentinula lateritia]|nr:MAG: hypothetical protein NXY57DRAFT_578734 [Lentinula lateritia]